MVDVLAELKNIIAEADAKIQATLQPMVESGSDTAVALAKKAVSMVQDPIKNIMVSLDKDWSDEEKGQRVKDYIKGKNIT